MEQAVKRVKEKIYSCYSKYLEDIIYPLILLLWSLIKVNQGVDVSDSTYSLGNYLYPDNIQLTWKLSTYLSNGLGAFLIRLPGGDTLLGANIYTGLILSLIALVVYYALKREFGASVLFVGEFVAISFCWIPTGILYNYMSYLLFSIGAILIYYAVKKEKLFYYLLAGIVLGLNVFVRIPNITEAALIIAVLYGELMIGSTEGAKYKKLYSVVGYCIAGYLTGVIIPLVIIITTYGFSGISEMLAGLTGMTNSDSTYGPMEMILSTVRAYGRSLKWAGIIIAVVFAGTLMMAAVKKNKNLKNLGRVIYILVILLMVRFFWGRGMFSLRYYEDYTSMFEWGMMILMLAWICVILVLLSNRYNILVKTMAMIVLCVLVVTPLGSNNYTCQNLNNMFLVMPFVIYVVGGLIYAGAHRFRLEGILYGCNFPWMSMVTALLIITVFQTTLFHVYFVFRDGMDGAKRDYVITKEQIPSLAGMHTNADNAIAIETLYDYIDSERGNIESAIYWGGCPGVAYILRLPSAITTTWPDLDSFQIDSLDNELVQLAVSEEADRTVVIWRKSDSLSGNNAMMKEDILTDYIVSNKLEAVYENDEYLVYK